jgi:hypothetical protein
MRGDRRDRFQIAHQLGQSTAPLARPRSTTLSTPSELLLRDVPAAYRTQINDALLAALAKALASEAGPSAPEAIWIDMEGHGREALDDTLDVSRTISAGSRRSFPRGWS